MRKAILTTCLGVLCALALAVAAFVAPPSTGLVGEAEAHFFSGNASVNTPTSETVIVRNRTRCGCHLEGMKKWNGVDSRLGGRAVHYAYDNNQNAGATLVIRDYSRRDGRAGFYTESGSPDQMYLNYYYMSGYSQRVKNGVATHELGHAQTFDHPPRTEYYRKNAVMYFQAGNRENPGYHDFRDAKVRWVK